MPNIVKIGVENSDELLNAAAYGAGAVVQVQSAAAEAGPFTDDGTVGLVAGTRIHTYFDADGTSSTWYRTRYENAAGTTTSDWSAVFQVGDETAGLLCSLYDVKQALGKSASDTAPDEELLDLIRQASDEIIQDTGRQLAPDPASGTKIIELDHWIGRTGSRDLRRLWFPRGVRSVATLEIKDGTGGTYATVPAGDVFLNPPAYQRDAGWPATIVQLSDAPASANSRPTFYEGYRVVRLTGSFGFSSVPGPIQRLARHVVVGEYRSGGTGIGERVTVGLDGERVIDRHLSRDDWRVLARYRHLAIA